MKTENAHDVIDGYLQDLKLYAGKISPKFNMEDVHQFRTTTKKLRSLLRLHGFEKKILPKNFLHLYHIAGELRNAQVLLVEFADHGTRLPGMYLWLATYIAGKQQQWKKHHPNRDVKQVKQKIAAVNLVRPSIQELRSFFNDRLQEVHAIVSCAAPEDEALHTARKRIKDLVYVKQWCKDAWPVGWNATRQVSLISLKKLSDVAGDFNDRRVGMDLLALHLEQEEALKQKRAARRFEVSQRKDTANTKKELIDALQKYSARFAQPKD